MRAPVSGYSMSASYLSFKFHGFNLQLKASAELSLPSIAIITNRFPSAIFVNIIRSSVAVMYAFFLVFYLFPKQMLVEESKGQTGWRITS